MTSASAPPGPLGERRYVSLTTFRRDGTPVATPLWVVPDDAGLAVWTVTDSWKVKRIRHNPAVTVAPCDMRGRVAGEPVPGQAVILDDAGTQRTRELIRRKYGLFGRLTIWMSLLRRGPRGSVGIRVTLDQPG